MSYDHQELLLRDKKIKYRPWRYKDGKKVHKAKENADTKESKLLLKQGFVYDCLLNDVTLSESEFQYMLLMIRSKSIGSDLSYVFDCKECKKEFEYSKEIEDIFKQKYKNYGNIEEGGLIIEIGNIQNQDFYDSIMIDASPQEKIYFDLLLHIKKINDDESFTFESLREKFENIDIKTFEGVIKKWNDIMFKVDNINVVQCTHCKHEESIVFDDIPNFFPKSWL